MIQRAARCAAAMAMAVVVASGCTVAGPRPAEPVPDRPRPADPTRPAEPRPGAPAVPGAEPQLRVGLTVGAASVRLDAAGPYELVDEGGRVQARSAAGAAWTVARSGAGVEAEGADGRVRVAGTLVARPTGDAPVRVDGRAYRGAVLLRPAERGVTVVNLLDLEAYLLGVVPHEIGAGRPPEELEAVKAQAVAARTYAIRHMGRRDALGFDVYATVMDQVYGGLDSEDPTSSEAVRATRGQIVAYDGVPIEAYYHSTCGGSTAAIEEVWPGEPRPYLRSVSDRRDDGGWYCETSNRFRWSERWDQARLVETLRRTIPERGVATGEVTRVESMAIEGWTRSGRVSTLRIRTNLGEHRIGGDSIRWVLQPAPNRILNSSAISIRTTGDRRVESLEVDGVGWGHGIGMCQVGALGRARAGHSYRDILSAYYPGTRIERLYR